MVNAWTGLKRVGDGEWQVLKHRPANKWRSWPKLHLGVDADGFIVAAQLTDSGVADASVAVAILHELGGRIGRFRGDGACATRAV